MAVTFVSAFLDLKEDRSNDKSVDTCFEHFKTLISSNVQLILFTSKIFQDRINKLNASPNLKVQYIELEDLDTYKLVKETSELPSNRNSYHDTRNFMILMNAKIEFVKRAMDLNLFATNQYSWIDFSIFHVLRNKNESTEFLKLLGNSQLKEGIYLPGCWSKTVGFSSIYQSVNWRFCGGFFIGTRDSLNELYRLYQEHFAKIIERTLIWEVNLWTILEQSYGWSPKWFKADHNDSIIRLPKEYFKIVASLTTIPSRIESSCRIAIDSLINQVDKIYLSVPLHYKRFNTAFVQPAYLEEEPYKDKVELVVCDDFGPATKYLGGLEKIPDHSWVFFCDDDQEYNENLIQRMLESVDSINSIYQNRYQIIQKTTSGGLIHGYVGNLANTFVLKDLPSFSLPECAYHVDDQWMSIYYFLNGATIKQTGIENYSEIFSVLENNHEKIGKDSLASLGTRDNRVQQLADYFGLKFTENGGLEKRI